jgi:hypothetical protein
MLNPAVVKQPSVMGDLEMLAIHGIDCDHVPRSTNFLDEGAACRKFVRILVVVERELKEGLGAEKEIDLAMPYTRRITKHPRERGRAFRTWYRDASPVDAESPVMKGALDGITNDVAISEIGMHVWASGIEYRDLTRWSTKGHQSLPEQIL